MPEAPKVDWFNGNATAGDMFLKWMGQGILVSTMFAAHRILGSKRPTPIWLSSIYRLHRFCATRC